MDSLADKIDLQKIQKKVQQKLRKLRQYIINKNCNIILDNKIVQPNIKLQVLEEDNTENHIINILRNNGNKYVRYVPIHRQVQTEEFSKKIFPVLIDQIDLQKIAHKYIFRKDLTPQIKWAHLKKKLLLHLDLSEILTIQIYFQNNLNYREIKNYFDIKCQEQTIDQGLKQFKYLMFQDKEIMLQLKSLANNPQELNNILCNEQKFFCAICKIFHCFQHNLLSQDEFHYSNPQLESKLKNQTIQRIKKFINTIYDIKNPDSKELFESCSKGCYKRLNKNQILSKLINIAPVINSQTLITKIRMGIESLGYDSCEIWRRDIKNFNCQQIFFYFIKQCDIIKLSDIEPEEYEIIKKRKIQKLTMFNQKIYQPCKHNFTDESNSRLRYLQDCSDCQCGVQNQFCDKYCSCDSEYCTIKRQGCKCQGNCKQNICPCFLCGAECDPDLCTNCFDTDECGLIMINQERNNKIQYCRNNEIIFNCLPRTIITQSQIQGGGYGLVLAEPVEKGQLITLYIGELITDFEQELRAILDGSEDFYAFEVVEKVKLVDSRFLGNKSRFINHSKLKNNCEVRIVYSKGSLNIAFYALDNLVPGVELFIDYDGNNTLIEKYPWILAEIRKKTLQKQTSNQ